MWCIPITDSNVYKTSYHSCINGSFGSNHSPVL